MVKGDLIKLIFEGSFGYFKGGDPGISLRQVIDEQQNIFDEEHGWLFSRLVLPVDVFEFGDEIPEDKLTAISPIKISVTGSKTGNLAGLLGNVRKNIGMLDSAAQNYPGIFEFDSYEIILPETSIDFKTNTEIIQVIKAVNEIVFSATGDNFKLFYRLPVNDLWKTNLETLSRLISLLNEKNKALQPVDKTEENRNGLSIYLDNIVFQDVSFAEITGKSISVCRNMDIPLKIHIDEKDLLLDSKGYNKSLNIVLAYNFACAENLDEASVRQILEVEQLTGFEFEDSGISWNDHHISLEKIRDIKANHPLMVSVQNAEELLVNIKTASKI